MLTKPDKNLGTNIILMLSMIAPLWQERHTNCKCVFWPTKKVEKVWLLSLIAIL